MVFIPTYLYIKQHTKTGKLYFGKTIRDPLKYKGSGTHWSNHIMKHGREHVTTLWYQLYDNVFDLVADALGMSNSLDIINSKSWLNIISEIGIGGTEKGESHPCFGIPLSDEHKNKISIGGLGLKKSKETRNKMRKPKSKTHIENMVKARTGAKASFTSRNNQCHRIDVLLPCGIILYDTTRLELSIYFNLNFSSLKKYFIKNIPYKGFSIIK